MEKTPEMQAELQSMAAKLSPVLRGGNPKKRGTVKNPYVCDDWSEAFDLCRQLNRPIMARVARDGMAKIYPSGSSVRYDSEPNTKWNSIKP